MKCKLHLGHCHKCGKARKLKDGPYGNMCFVYCKACVEAYHKRKNSEVQELTA